MPVKWLLFTQLTSLSRFENPKHLTRSQGCSAITIDSLVKIELAWL